MIVTFIISYHIYENKNIDNVSFEDMSIESEGKEDKEEEQKNKEEIKEEEAKNKEEKEEQEKIIIHIAGAVNCEGILEIGKNSRIADAIEKAKGLKQNANLSNINLASKIEDGTKIYIPTNEEVEGGNKYIIGEDIGKENKKSKVNINTAEAEELDLLSGIGPSTATKIVEYRKQNKGFKKIEDIKNVSGIGEAKFEQIKDLICI